MAPFTVYTTPHCHIILHGLHTQSENKYFIDKAHNYARNTLTL